MAEIKRKLTCDREDLNILSSKHPDDTQITYILSLGVHKEFRRFGIGEYCTSAFVLTFFLGPESNLLRHTWPARHNQFFRVVPSKCWWFFNILAFIASILLDTLLSHLNSSTDCKAVYLHVLCSNEVAIKFYEKRSFQNRTYLPKYYTINNQLKDGYCFVLYMNEGKPPFRFSYPFGKMFSTQFHPIFRKFSLTDFFYSSTDFFNDLVAKANQLNPCFYLLQICRTFKSNCTTFCSLSSSTNQNKYTSPTKDLYRIS